MKAFRIVELLIFNPNLQSLKKKPIEIDMQYAKIMACFPEDAPIEQKCNTVGMAEGVYEFCRTLTGDSLEKSTRTPKTKYKHAEDSLLDRVSAMDNDQYLLTGVIQQQIVTESWKYKPSQVISMDTCTLVMKEVYENIWIFLRLDHNKCEKYGRIGDSPNYLESGLSYEACQAIVSHVYLSFFTFYGLLTRFLFREYLGQLQKIITKFVPLYSQVFKLEDSLNMLAYALPDIRYIPLDINSTLKFSYFKNVLQSYDQAIAEIIIFAQGLLAYSSLSKEHTEYFGNYLFGTGEPYRFYNKNCFRFLSENESYASDHKLGVLHNSISLGFDETYTNNGSRMSLSNLSMKGNSPYQSDLLGLNDGRYDLLYVFLQQNGEIKGYYLNFYSEKGMMFLTFYKEKASYNQLIFQNRFYHDNADKFTAKISYALGTISGRNYAQKFLFTNKGTFAGKSTIKDWGTFGLQLEYALRATSAESYGIVATTFCNNWVYAVRRLSRQLILLIPSYIPLHKLDDYVNKMAKYYFLKAYI